MYGPKLPVTGISLVGFAFLRSYDYLTFILLIITITLLFFRFSRLIIKEGKLKTILNIFILIFIILSFIFVSVFVKKFLFSKELNNINTNLSNSNNINHSTNTNNCIQELIYAPSDGKIFGTLLIDKIDLNLKILEGTQAKQLIDGVGHIKDTPFMWEDGNCFLAAHYIKKQGSMFSRLDELEIGDTVKVETINGNYTYIVYRKAIVDTDDTKCFDVLEGNKNLSLVTCTNSKKQRLIVYCNISI